MRPFRTLPITPASRRGVLLPGCRKQMALLSCLLVLTSSCTRHRFSYPLTGSANPFVQQTVDVEAIERLILGHVKTSVSELQLERVKVLLKSEESLEGIIGSIGQDSFALHVADQAKAIAFGDVAKVEKAKERLSQGSIAAIVAGVGLAVYGVIALLVLTSD